MRRFVLESSKNATVGLATAIAARDYLSGLQDVLARLDHGVVDKMAAAIWKGYQDGRTLFLFGNGGSAALASHFACDIGKGTITNGCKRLRAISLTDNVALITAWANDAHYRDIFAEQLRNLVQKHDLALAISASGNSENVLRGLEAAREAGAQTLAITGFQGGRVKHLADLCLIVPSDNIQHIEDAHLCVTHALLSTVRQRMGQANGD